MLDTTKDTFEIQNLFSLSFSWFHPIAIYSKIDKAFSFYIWSTDMTNLSMFLICVLKKRYFTNEKKSERNNEP